MRHIIFLDFDGVLHPDGIGTFSNVPVFEKYLRQLPEVEIVISSTWREDHFLDELQQFFSPEYRHQITGVTPFLEEGYDKGGRLKEIHTYLAKENLDASNCRWLAIDDLEHLFGADCPNLLLTDFTIGFTDKDGEALLAWYQAQAK